MFPANFEYFRATSVGEAIRLLGQNEGAKVLAGGHSLIPTMKLRLAQPAALIDIGRIAELKGVTQHGETCRVGALTTHCELASSEVLRKCCGLLTEAASQVADPAVRNKGTIGGNIAHADPASDLPAVLLALGATVHIEGPRGTRSVAAADFFTGLLETDLDEAEILTSVEVPCLGRGTGSTYLKFEHPASGYALCGAAAVVELGGDGKCKSASLAFNGITPVAHHAAAVGEALAGSEPDDRAIDRAVAENLEIREPLGDVLASGEYRLALAEAYGKRALRKARDRARESR